MSVVPRKLVHAVVPALPRSHQPADAVGCQVALPEASEVRTSPEPGLPPIILMVPQRMVLPETLRLLRKRTAPVAFMAQLTPRVLRKSTAPVVLRAQLMPRLFVKVTAPVARRVQNTSRSYVGAAVRIPILPFQRAVSAYHPVAVQ